MAILPTLLSLSFYLAETAKPSGLKTLYRFSCTFQDEIIVLLCQATTASLFLLNSFLSNFSSNGIYSMLPHFWGVRITYTVRSKGLSPVPVSWHASTACAPHIFFSGLVFPQCPSYLTQTRSSQPRRNVGNSFQSLLSLIHLLVRFLTGHKTFLFPSQGKSGTYWSLDSGNIKDWNHQKWFFLINWSFTSKHLLLLIGMSKARPSHTFSCRNSFC